MNSINFKASFVKSIYLPHKNSDEEYEPSRVSIVELDTNDKNDTISLFDTAVRWDRICDNFSFQIFNDAVKPFGYDNIEKEHYFAVTSQEDDYEKLDPDKILGLSLFSETNTENDELSWLQIHPDCTAKTYLFADKPYTGVGKGIVNYLKSIAIKPIYVQSDDNAVDFYKKQGFKAVEGDIASHLIWEG